MTAYVALVYAYESLQPGFQRMEYREIMPVVICMLVIGVVQYYVLRCIRLQLTTPTSL
jgi:hypothetical protein